MLNPIAPPPLEKSPLNLIDSTDTPPDLTAGRWVNGMEFRPWPTTHGWVDDPCTQRLANDIDPSAPGYYPLRGLVDYRPPVFRIHDRGSTFGFEVMEYAERAGKLSDVAIYKQLETELWSGAQAIASGWTNPYLTNPATVVNVSTLVTGGVPTVRRGVEILEQCLADYGVGARGMIHLRPEAIPRLAETVRRDKHPETGNPRLLTANDTIVIPGSGYPNTGPGGAAAGYGTTWMYATGWVETRVDPYLLFPNPDDYITYDDGGGVMSQDTNSFIGAAMDRAVNDVVVRAERFAGAWFDPACHFAIRVTLDT